MNIITDTKVVSGYSGCLRITFLAENLKTGVAKLFSTRFSIPDKGFSLGESTMKGRTRDTAYATDCTGEGVGLVSGVTTYNESELSITFGDDYNVLQSIDPTISRNLLVSVFKGGTFTYEGEIWGVIGTNGTRNIGTKRNSRDFRYLFLKEGEVIEPDLIAGDGSGKAVTSPNNFVTAFKDNTLICVEYLHSASDVEVKGGRLVYVLGGEVTFNEASGTDYNKYTITAKKLSDVMSIENYVIQGPTNPEEISTTETTPLTRANVDYVFETATATAPTATAVDGETALAINTATGLAKLYVYGTSAWVEATNTIIAGTQFYSSVYSTDLSEITGAAVTNKAVYVAAKAYNAGTNAITVVSAKTGTGTGTNTYCFDCMDWSFLNRAFVNYIND